MKNVNGLIVDLESVTLYTNGQGIGASLVLTSIQTVRIIFPMGIGEFGPPYKRSGMYFLGGWEFDPL